MMMRGGGSSGGKRQPALAQQCQHMPGLPAK